MNKRIIALVSAFAFLFTALIGRCAYISFSDSYSVSDSYNSYTINIGKLYPYIYDKRGEKLNNNSITRVAIIRPNEKCLSELDKLFTVEEISEITNELSKGYPVIMETHRNAQTKYIHIAERINENDTNMLCRHLLDYQCGGLEAYTNNIIGELNVNFPLDASGRILNGNSELIDNNYSSTDGVIISIDSKLQKICEECTGSIEKGAVVIMDTATSQVLASVSIGDDYNNRALSSYAVGSVFKLVVCVCALEKGISPLYNCTSSIKVSDMVFSCQNSHSHGMQNMKQALANSCNCYFVNLALKLGADALYSTAKELGFGESFNLYDGWNIKAGNMPSLETISDSSGQLALLGFGQGELTDSPVHFASVVSAIANGGNYSYPTIDIDEVKANKVMSEKTADTVLEYMHYVVTNGTGANANYKGMTSGKTATAQSGVYSDNKELLNTWFAGVYPSSNPRYAIVVMCENGVSGSEDCCPIFRSIVEKISAL